MKKVMLQAHKGVEREFPENTMAAYLAAVEQGYDAIELDVQITKDGRFAMLHDRVINRTARLADGSELPREMLLDSLTYAEALEYDFGLSFSEKFRGERIPLFSEVLELSARTGVALKVDNKIRNFSPEDRLRLYQLINESGANAGISCWEGEADTVLREIPRATLHFDMRPERCELERLNGLVGRDRLFIWFPLNFDRASWAPKEWFATPERVESVRDCAKVGLWAIRDREQFREGCRLYDPDIAETDGLIKPER